MSQLICDNAMLTSFTRMRLSGYESGLSRGRAQGLADGFATGFSQGVQMTDEVSFVQTYFDASTRNFLKP